ncbi:V-type proton ATPase catalytic subunit A [Zea mays]|uniref:V-type proton ATPase catalytic subunit A n=1 Tax=Zea mays TaxID=4577 RepID=A0A317Y2S2_MAIZE|nr:V-type proton ATPase catalytic subunit A [Zea mays]
MVTSPPNVQTPSGAAYSVLDGSTNKAHKSVTGKRARTSPSKKVAKKLFRDEDTGDDDVAGSGDIVFENTLMQHHVALPPGSMRKISYIAPAGQTQC